MATIEELVVTLSAETSGLRSELKAAQVSLEKSTNSMTKAVDSFAKDGAKSTSFFQTAFATMAGFVGGQLVTRAIDTATGLFKGLFNELIVNGISAASATETAMNDLLSSLSRSGNYVGGARDDFEEFAGALQNTTKYGDDAILSTASLLENLTRLDSEGLKGATKATVDFAAAMNIDLNTAAQTVGKAIEGNVGALGRYGIKVDAGANKAETLANVMQSLNDRFGGAAASQLKTYSGITTALGNSWQDVTKVIGNAIIQNPAVVSALGGLNKLIQTLGSELKGATPAFMNLIANALKPAASAFNAVAQGALFFVSQINGLTLKNAVTELDSLEEAQAKVQKNLENIKNLGQSQSGIFTFDQKAVADLEAQNKLLEERIDKQRKLVTRTEQDSTKIDESLSAISAATTKFAEGINNFDTTEPLKAVADNFKSGSDSVNKLVSELKNAEDASISFAQTLLDSSASAKDRYGLELGALVESRNAELITEKEFLDAKQELLISKQAEEQALLAQGLADAHATREQAKAATNQLEKQQSLELAKFGNERKEKEKLTQKEREENTKATLDNIAALSSSSNKTLAAIGKAAAISQATIDGIGAVQKALNSGIPYPFNLAAAALVGVAAAANVAKISGVQLAGGIDSVPGIGSRDNFPAVLAPGERVVPTKTNEDLTKFLSGEGTAGAQITVNITMNDIFSSDPREMGLKIINTINETAQANGVKILGGSIA